MFRRGLEVLVRAQQRDFVAQTKLRNERIDGSDLHSGPTAGISQFCSCNMILPSWLDQRQRRKPLDDLCAGLRTGEALEQFLQDKARGDDDVRPKQCFFQMLNFWFRSLSVPAKGQGPDASVDQERHERDRSAL